MSVHQDMTSEDNMNLEEQLRDILFTASGGISDMANKEVAQIMTLITKEIKQARKLAPNILSEITYTIDTITTQDRKSAKHSEQQKLVDELLKSENNFINELNKD